VEADLARHSDNSDEILRDLSLSLSLSSSLAAVGPCERKYWRVTLYWNFNLSPAGPRTREIVKAELIRLLKSVQPPAAPAESNWNFNWRGKVSFFLFLFFLFPLFSFPFAIEA